MQLPLQIAFREMPPSDAVEAKIRERAAKLDRYYNRIMSCRVVVETPHGRQHQGKLYHVRIDLTVPGGELLVRRAPAAHHAHEDVYVAIRDAFDAAQRQLEDYARRQRGDIKAHEPPALRSSFRKRGTASSRCPTGPPFVALVSCVVKDPWAQDRFLCVALMSAGRRPNVK